jgi:hypothetical protein
MKFKNENYNLKMTMIELKKQNEILQEENSKNSKLQNSLLKSFSKEKIENYNIESDIFSKIFKEHDELIKQTLNLEPYLKFEEKYFLSQKRNDVFNLKEFEEENKFIKCSQILKNVEESLELMRFHTQNKLKKEKIINNIQCSSDKENISNNILIDDEKNYLQEKFKNNNQNQVGNNFVFNTRNLTPIRQNEKKNNNLINKLNKKTDVDKIASNVEKIRDMFAPENFENNLIKTQHIMKK